MLNKRQIGFGFLNVFFSVELHVLTLLGIVNFLSLCITFLICWLFFDV